LTRSAIIVEVVRRPLVKAVLLSDTDVLGALDEDESVAAARKDGDGYRTRACRRSSNGPGCSIGWPA
jgi:hypothetical protein